MAKLPFPSPDLLAALQSGQAIAVVGSGLTKAAGGPTWEELLLGLAAEAEATRPEMQPSIAAALQDIRTGNYLNGASLLKDVLGPQFTGSVVRQIRFRSSDTLDSGALAAVLTGKESKETIALFSRSDSPKPRNLRPQKSHRILVQLNFRAIVTTNYDTLLEEALPDDVDVAVYSRSYPYLANRIQENHRFILKLHGDLHNKEDIVLARSDYANVQFDHGFRKALSGLFQAATPFWIGYGHNDPDLDLLLDQLRKELQLPGGFAIIQKGQISLEQRLKDALIFPTVLDSYEQIDTYLEQLAIASGAKLSFDFTARLPWPGQQEAEDHAWKLARDLSIFLGEDLSVTGVYPGSVKVTLRGRAEPMIDLMHRVETRDGQLISLLLSHGVSEVSGERIEQPARDSTPLVLGQYQPPSPRLQRGTVAPHYGKFIAGPYEHGMAVTLGNALRRCLFSAIEGAAITAVQIEGVAHEFSSIPGVVEDVTDIILNLKQIPLRLLASEPRILSVDVKGHVRVTAAHLATDPSIEIVDPDLHIATLNEEGRLKLQLLVKTARGYVSAERNLDESLGVGWIPVDSAHSPIRRVNYRCEPRWLAGDTRYDRLVLEIWTNGAVAPATALSWAASLLDDHLSVFSSLEQEVSPVEADFSEIDALLAKRIDELDLSVRSANSLKNANIHTLRDLVRRTEGEVAGTKTLAGNPWRRFRAFSTRWVSAWAWTFENRMSAMKPRLSPEGLLHGFVTAGRS